MEQLIPRGVCPSCDLLMEETKRVEKIDGKPWTIWECFDPDCGDIVYELIENGGDQTGRRTATPQDPPRS
jgi:hypothetical protein